MYNLDKTVEIFINYDINTKEEIIGEIVKTYNNITQKQLRRQIKHIYDETINNKKEIKNNKIQLPKNSNIILNKNINKIIKNTDNIIKEILDNEDKYSETTLEEKYYKLKSIIQKNPKVSRPKSVLEYYEKIIEEKNIVIVNIEEIEKEIIDRNTQKQIKEGKGIVGIYGYFDTKKGIFIYIGKDSNILLRARDKHHKTTGDLKIDRILQNDKEGRYEYRVIDTMKDVGVLVLDILERYYIKVFNTYHYENPEGMNYTKGGETSFGIETEANIDNSIVTREIKERHTIYRGERDGIKMSKRPKGGKATEKKQYKISTNGRFSDGTFRICLNTPNCDHEKQKINIVEVLDYFYEKYPKETITSTKAFEKNIGNFDKLHKLYLEGKLDKRSYNKDN